MLFAFYCLDRPDRALVRKENREAHLTYLRALGDRLKLAGPLTTDDGTVMAGSLLIVDLEDRAAAEAFAAGDPYAKAGLFADVSIHAFERVLPQ